MHARRAAAKLLQAAVAKLQLQAAAATKLRIPSIVKNIIDSTLGA